MDTQNFEDSLYQKTYSCPVCKNKFKSSEIRKGKTVFVETDLGLRQIFNPIMPDYYQALVCEDCGYAGVIKNFENLSPIQIRNIKEKTHPKYIPPKYPLVYDAKIAIDRYKKALYFAHIKGDETSERAYIAQKLALIYEDIKDEQNSAQYFNYAYNWYSEAYIEEDFPIMGMEEPHFLYNIAYLAYRIGNVEEAKKTLSKVTLNTSVSPTLKEKTDDFIQILKSLEK